MWAWQNAQAPGSTVRLRSDPTAMAGDKKCRPAWPDRQKEWPDMLQPVWPMKKNRPIMSPYANVRLTDRLIYLPAKIIKQI